MRRLVPFLLIFAAGAAAYAATRPSPAPPPPRAARTAVAFLAGGCFWSNETDLDHISGVIATISGYAGGRVANPSYGQVSAGGTGHLETVRVVYDPARISYAALLDRWFRTIDPLDGSGQFCDRGEEYRTAIFVRNAAERRAAEAAAARAGRALRAPLATRVLPARNFYPAEDYHQDYARKNPLRYRLYRSGCGRDARVREIWSRARSA